MSVTTATVRKLALALPETTEQPHHDLTSFRVKGKIFATMPPAGGRLHAFVADDEVAAYCAEFPAAVEELWWGKKLSGCRVLLRQAGRGLVEELLVESWRQKAPTRLLAEFDNERASAS
jgi:hypothetical protein